MGKPGGSCGEQEGSSEARPGAAEMLLQALGRQTLVLAVWLGEDLCHELEDHPGRCDPSSVQQIFPQLPLLCSSHHARCRTSNELGPFHDVLDTTDLSGDGRRSLI